MVAYFDEHGAAAVIAMRRAHRHSSQFANADRRVFEFEANLSNALTSDEVDQHPKLSAQVTALVATVRAKYGAQIASRAHVAFMQSVRRVAATELETAKVEKTDNIWHDLVKNIARKIL